jgi:hypothetical protein
MERAVFCVRQNSAFFAFSLALRHILLYNKMEYM